MTSQAHIDLKEIRVDGGPTKNEFLMKFQADLLGVPVVRSEATDASAFGAFIMNGFARGLWKDFDEAEALWSGEDPVMPKRGNAQVAKAYDGWKKAIRQLIK
ncbi:MAG: FGGY-family carbohydrate kinase, partial [Bacteroidales bacterium]